MHSFFVSKADNSLMLYGSYDYGMVALSLLIAILTSTMAMQVAGIARWSESRLGRQVALVSGSLALGGGVWAMHFIGMLAFSFCAHVQYSASITFLSMLPSLLASWVALQLMSRRRISRLQLVGGGVLVGIGIGAMHYCGMAAMQMAPRLRYDPFGFGLSLLVAIGLAILALWVRFGLRRWLSPGYSIIAGGLIMGLAISGMHYIGMAAARFIGAPDMLPAGGNEPLFLAMALTAITVTLTVLVAGANGLLRYRQLYLQLQSNETRLRGILDTAADGIVTFDADGIIQGANPTTGRMLGWSSEELTGRNIGSLLVDPDDLGSGSTRHWLVEDNRRLSEGREIEALHKDGSALPIKLALGEVSLPGQQLYVGFISDISGRRAMEKALRDSELQHRSLIRNIPGVSFRCLMDERWTVLFVSDAVERLTGWLPKDFMSGGKSFVELYHPDDLEPARIAVEAALSSSCDYQVQFRLRDRAGGERWVWESGTIVTDEQGKPRWIDGVMLDSTEKVERNAEFEGIVRAISRALAVIEFDLNGRILTANQNFLDLMGYRLEEIQGRHHQIFCAPEYVNSEAYRQFWTMLASGELHAGEYRRLGKDGREVWIQATYNPVFNANGKPFKVIKFATDMSLRREMEIALREAKEHAELAAASKTTFLANMSHEIRTPMNAVIGFTELLLQSELDDVQQRYLTTVSNSARSLLGLLNDILDTAKLERGAVELEQMPFSLRALCEQVCASLRLSAEAKGLVLSLDYPGDVSDTYLGDALRIQQVLTNLLSNAVKFTERGSVVVGVAADVEGVTFSVTDTGIGIPRDRLERIFEPFAQADATMSRRFGGTGLGTTIARQLIDLMGGNLSVESEVGIGSVFRVMLPIRAASMMPTERELPAAELPPLRILAADDVPLNLELLTVSLSKRGHTVTTASNGNEAVSAYLKKPFDVLLLDVQMPEKDGLQATREIRRHESMLGLRPAPILALTASVLEEDRRAAREAGMDGFASKPLDMNELLKEISRVTGLSAGIVDLVPAEAPLVTKPIDWQRGARLWGGRLPLAAAIGRFLPEARSLQVELCQGLNNDRYGETLTLGHRLRGSAGNLGLSELVALCSEVERWARHAQPGQGAGLANALTGALERLASELASCTQSDKVASNTVVDADTEEDIIAMAQTLRQVLLRGELDDQLSSRLLAFLSGSGRHHDAEALGRAIENFDFVLAEYLLDSLIRALHPSPEARVP